MGRPRPHLTFGSPHRPPGGQRSACQDRCRLPVALALVTVRRVPSTTPVDRYGQGEGGRSPSCANKSVMDRVVRTGAKASLMRPGAASNRAPPPLYGLSEPRRHLAAAGSRVLLSVAGRAMLRQFAVALRHLELATNHPASNQGHWSLAGGLTVVLGHCAVCSGEAVTVCCPEVPR